MALCVGGDVVFVFQTEEGDVLFGYGTGAHWTHFHELQHHLAGYVGIIAFQLKGNKENRKKENESERRVGENERGEKV